MFGVGSTGGEVGRLGAYKAVEKQLLSRLMHSVNCGVVEGDLGYAFYVLLFSPLLCP